jgi:hypothetical protein
VEAVGMVGRMLRVGMGLEVVRKRLGLDFGRVEVLQVV